MMVGAFIFGSGLIFFGFVRELWMFYAATMFMSLGTSMMGQLVMSTSITHWFRRRAALANSIVTSGLAFSGLVFIPLIVLVQNSSGWRTAAMLTGFSVWIIGLPTSMLMRQAPEKYGLLPDGDQPGAAKVDSPKQQKVMWSTHEFTVKEALRTRAFWCIAVANGVAMLGRSGFLLFQFAHMEEGMHIPRTSAALVITTMSAFTIGGGLFGGVVGDMLPKNKLLAASQVMVGVAFIILGVSTSFEVAMLSGILYGISTGIQRPVTNAIRGEYFGRTSFGKIFGFSSLLAGPLAVAGPIIVGRLRDIQGNYVMGFIILGVCSLCAGGLWLVGVAPKPPTPSLTGSTGR